MEKTRLLSDNDIWRMVYLLGGDDYTPITDHSFYVLSQGECIATVSLDLTAKSSRIVVGATPAYKEA